MPDLASTIGGGLIPPRIRLRRFRDSDADVFFREAFSRSDAMQFESTLPHTHVQQTRVRIRQLMNSKHAEEFVVEARVEQDEAVQDEAVPAASSAVVAAAPSVASSTTITVSSDPEIPIAPPISQEQEIPQTQLADEFGDFSVSEEDVESEEAPFIPVGKVCMYKCEGDWWIGYLIFPKHWRKGYATEAVGTLLEWALRCHSAFSEAEPTGSSASTSTAGSSSSSPRLPQFNADIDPRNEASLQLLMSKFNARRVGFQKCSMQVGGQWVDSVFVALNRQDFESSKWKQQFLTRYSHLPLIDRRAERNLHRRKQVVPVTQEQQSAPQQEDQPDTAFLEYM